MSEKKSDEKKVEQYKLKLEHLKEEILKDIKNMNSDGDSMPEISVGHGMHMADAASDMYDREFSLNLASNDRELLQKIDEALARIEQGNFGKCLACQGEIPAMRLNAIPYVERCLKCQEKLEEKTA
ncbi:MAG: TraR/DksA family transcriptional regulator [Candidatus Omnitrophota bacterium]